MFLTRFNSEINILIFPKSHNIYKSYNYNKTDSKANKR